MRRLRSLLPAAAALAAAAVAAPVAVAAPPPNDAPEAAGVFEPYAAKAGPPSELQAVAELNEATPDPGVTPCLGATSFARTVWYRIPAAGLPREVTIEASGRTTELVDLAAFVQPVPGVPARSTWASACAGRGVKGGDATEDHTTALSLRLPPQRAVLVQVGRRGPVRSADDDRAELALASVALGGPAPKGDRAGRGTPTVPRSGHTRVQLSGGTTTDEDVATPRCASRATIWRRVRPRRSGTLTFTVEGRSAGTLAVFRGPRPEPKGFADCVDREGAGPLVLPVRVRARRQLWVRIGTDAPAPGARSTLRVRRASAADRRDGGGCLGRLESTVAGGLASPSSQVKALNKARYVVLALRVARGPLCSAKLTLAGPKGAVFGSATFATIRGRTRVAVRRSRKLVRGRYRLRVEAAGLARLRTPVPSTVAFTLR